MIRGDASGRVKTLIHQFEYPRLGPGMMWEACRDRVEAAGGRVELGARVVELQHDGSRVDAVVIERGGERRTQPASHVISTMAVKHLVQGLRPHVPSEVRAS